MTPDNTLEKIISEFTAEERKNLLTHLQDYKAGKIEINEKWNPTLQNLYDEFYALLKWFYENYQKAANDMIKTKSALLGHVSFHICNFTKDFVCHEVTVGRELRQLQKQTTIEIIVRKSKLFK